MAFRMAVVALAFLVLESECFSLTVDAQYQIVPPGNTVDRFMCQADVPLVGCQVMNLHSKKIYELSNGNLSEHYWGSGLQNGQCGFNFAQTRKDDYYTRYGCRARAHDTAWQYETAIKESSSNNSILPVTTGPRRLIVAPGSNVTLTFTAGEAISSCDFKWGDRSWFSSGSSKEYSIDVSKIKDGLCSLTMLNVKTETSGIVGSHLSTPQNNGKTRYFKQSTTLIVTEAPGAPALTFSKADGVYKENDIMVASCSVGPVRPLARISWSLNDDAVLGEAEDFSNLPWEYEAANITWKLNRILSLADHGKVLVCRAHHVALPGGLVETSRRITVQRATVSASAFSTSDRGLWLLSGIGGSLFVVGVVLATLLGVARAKRKWCFMRPGNGGNRTSILYDDVGPAQVRGGAVTKYGPRPESAEYVEVL